MYKKQILITLLVIVYSVILFLLVMYMFYGQNTIAIISRWK